MHNLPNIKKMSLIFNSTNSLNIRGTSLFITLKPFLFLFPEADREPQIGLIDLNAIRQGESIMLKVSGKERSLGIQVYTGMNFLQFLKQRTFSRR